LNGRGRNNENTYLVGTQVALVDERNINLSKLSDLWKMVWCFLYKKRIDLTCTTSPEKGIK